MKPAAAGTCGEQARAPGFHFFSSAGLVPGSELSALRGVTFPGPAILQYSLTWSWKLALAPNSRVSPFCMIGVMQRNSIPIILAHLPGDWFPSCPTDLYSPGSLNLLFSWEALGETGGRWELLGEGCTLQCHT